jgi:transcriptional regulator GlxA family with amidase domain
VITAAGVSSGIDMALRLLDRMYGPAIGQSLQLAIDYDPRPPFDAGSPSKAPADVIELAKAALGDPAPAGPPGAG